MRWLLAMSLAASTSWAADPVVNCASPSTTLDFNICGSREADKADVELKRYFEAARTRMVKQEPQAVQALDAAQAAWLVYKSKHCESAYLRWQGGTIRGPAGIQCEVDLTRQRTHRIWADFLTYPDRTPPVLPEPQQ